MAAIFFEKEVKKAQERFNESFGEQTVCDLQARSCAILSICSMDRLRASITHEKDRHAAKGDIRAFLRIRKALNHLFALAERQKTEGSDHGTTVRCKDERSTVDARSGSVPDLRQRLQDRVE